MLKINCLTLYIRLAVSEGRLPVKAMLSTELRTMESKAPMLLTSTIPPFSLACLYIQYRVSSSM